MSDATPEEPKVEMTPTQIAEIAKQAVQQYIEEETKKKPKIRVAATPPSSQCQFHTHVHERDEYGVPIRVTGEDLDADGNCPRCKQSHDNEMIYNPPPIAIACPSCNSIDHVKQLNRKRWRCFKERCQILFDAEGKQTKIPWG